MGLHIVEKPKEKLNKVLIYPNLKKDANDKVDLEVVSKEEIDTIAHHYIKQLLLHITNRGFPIDRTVYRDIDLTFESLKSALLRSVGKYHPLQGYVDTIYEMEGSRKSKSKDDPKKKD